MNKENYLKNVVKIKSLLQQGEIYELNYCQEYFAENIKINNPIAKNKIKANTEFLCDPVMSLIFA